MPGTSPGWTNSDALDEHDDSTQVEAALPFARIERVAQAVADQIERQHHQENR